MDVALELTEPQQLAARLRSVLRGPALGRVAVGILSGGKSCAIAVHDAQRPEEDTDDAEVLVGCATKLFTASMLWEAVACGRCDLDRDVTEVAGGALGHEAFRGITLRHLLEHAHGFDDSAFTSAPRRADGLLDIDALCASLQSAPRLAESGTLYSYGSSGALLIAGILERLRGQPFAELLFRFLRLPTPPTYVCPATGASFAISLEQLLRFLARQGWSDDGMLAASESTAIGRTSRALPGWHSTESGIYLGWKDYGAGWYGHNSEMPGAGLLVRLHPRRRIGVVVSSGVQSPAAIAGALFRKVMPDLVRLTMPRLQKETTLGFHEASRLRGTYANRTIAVRLSASGQGGMTLTLTDRNDGRTLLDEVQLHPAERQVFFLHPAALEHFPFVQLVGESESGYEYLWTGSQVLKRVQE